jgi:hypothetical protein
MRHFRSESTGPDQLFETVECQPTILPQVTRRQRSVVRTCRPVCRLSVSIGSLHGLWQIATWSEPS